MQATHVLAACQKGVQLRPGHSIFAEQHLRCLWQAFNSCKQIWQVIPPKLLITRSALVWKPRLLHRRKVPRAGLPHLAVRELFGVLRAARHCGGQSPAAQLPLQRALVARRLRWPDPGTEKEATWTLAISEEEVSEKEQTELRKIRQQQQQQHQQQWQRQQVPNPTCSRRWPRAANHAPRLFSLVRWMDMRSRNLSTCLSEEVRLQWGMEEYAPRTKTLRRILGTRIPEESTLNLPS